jgi:HD-GYP domain-containing protein (c-di-GMP phosphodiesterase class II)
MNILFIVIMLITCWLITFIYFYNHDTNKIRGYPLTLYGLKRFISTAPCEALLITSEDKLENLLDETVISLAKAIDARDPYTSFHSGRVAKYSFHIANRMGLINEARNIMIGAQLHDIGKISIPEHILTKPERLTESEEQIMRQHPVNGYEIIRNINELISRGVHDIILYHHERYDGKGYPYGLSGTDIPLSARIVAVADSFDAMTTKKII